MLVALFITIGVTTYDFNLSYPDMKTCEYHAKRVYDSFLDISSQPIYTKCKEIK